MKMYLTDLDHTFLRSDLSVSNYSKKIWNKTAKSALLSIATARSYKKAMQFLDGLTFNSPMILLDGSLVVDNKKDIIDMQVLDKKISDAIIDEGAKYKIYPFIIALKDTQLNELFIYPSFRNNHQDQLLERYKGDDHLLQESNIKGRENTFKLVYMGEEKLLRPLYEHLKSVFGTQLEYKLAPEAYLKCYYLTILHYKADKAYGMSILKKNINIDYNDITVFGDGINDLGMFKYAKTAIAVNNALDEVKKQANIILPNSNDEDAVARYLETQIIL